MVKQHLVAVLITYGTLTLKVGVITNEVRGPSCGPYNAVPSQSGFGYVGSVTVTPIDITNKIPKGIHTISSSDIDSEHALTLEAVTSPSEKSMVLYDKPKTIWVEDKIESKSLSDLYSLIRPMLSMPLNSSESMSKDVTTAISKATGTTMGNLNNPFIVNANESCIDTGFMVSQGDSIQFLAIGQATYGFEGSPIDNTPVTNPDGDRSVNNINIGKKLDSNNINPSAPTGSLVGKVGWNGNYFYIGSGNQLTMPASGNIILCYNDVEGNYIDNGGYYRVDIYRK
jgi:hypothetical protein